jgi:hypothetical protein
MEANDVNVEFHILRSCARAIDGRDRQDIDFALSNAYAALEGNDVDTAWRWFVALRVAIETYSQEYPATPAGRQHGAATDALERVARLIEGV